ncbi:MAG: M67 family metallopeptidase [Caldilineaceae bacterium]|nr:M67 family metallopeptidase [Caldilineaceae bacterium]
MTQDSLTAGPLYLPPSVYDEIVAHARSGKPEEICGILRGRGGQTKALYRARNVAADKIKNYAVDAQTLLLQFDFEDAGDEMIAVYHSHPVSPAYPSATDAWNAHYPDSLYVICSLQDDNAPDVRAFSLIAHTPALDASALRTRLTFTEARPGLFAHFQAADAPLPPELAHLTSETAPPFYLVRFDAPEDDRPAPLRLVTVREHPVRIEDAMNAD